MNEETPSKDQRTIKLTPEQYRALERAMQWPEDLSQYDRNNEPTNMGAILKEFTRL